MVSLGIIIERGNAAYTYWELSLLLLLLLNVVARRILIGNYYAALLLLNVGERRMHVQKIAIVYN